MPETLMEQAFIWNPLNFSTADVERAAFHQAAVTFPENFSYEDKN